MWACKASLLACFVARPVPTWVCMYIQAIPNRGSPPAILLRESYREGGKVKKRTLCNLTHWPPHLLDGFKALLKGGTVIPTPASPEVFVIQRALPHGHVAAVLGSLRQIGLDRILGPDGDALTSIAGIAPFQALRERTRTVQATT